jgi:hypothetical protein
MKIEDRLKIYQGFAETGRKWSQIMDAKAGFLSTLSVALIVFIWTGAKIGEVSGYVHWLALSATVIALVSLFISLYAVVPRTTLKQIFDIDLEYANGYMAVSFFGYVANNYPHDKHNEFITAVDAMDEEGFAREALEQHYTISHVVQKKSNGIALASMFWFIAVITTIVALFLKG